MRRERLLELLERGELRQRLEPVYGDDAAEACGRLQELVAEYADVFPCDGDSDTWLFSAPGRAELGGSHTDHQHGRGLAASVNRDTIACVVPNGSSVIRVKSRNHRMAEVDLGDLCVHPPETGSSPALVRGIAARFRQMGRAIGGFDAYTTTNVLRGRGLSSSAAFEVLVASIMNHLYCAGSLTPVQTALAAHYAENCFFGKPSGLLDQRSCAVGGVIEADIRDPESPLVRRFPLDLAQRGCALCMLDDQVSHADLVEDFAAIPREMGEVARCLGRQFLRDVRYETFLEAIPRLRSLCGDRAVLRAYHFFQEDRRVPLQCQALEEGDMEAFFRLARQSGRSSFMFLQNASNYRDSAAQPLAVLQALAEELLGGRGAVRVHGGGFAGTVAAFVPLDLLEGFVQGMEAMAGRGICHVLNFRSTGAALLVN